MSEQSVSNPVGGVTSNRSTGSAPVASPGGSALSTSKGTTTINDVVVSKIAGIAAHEVSGVHAMGSGASRAMGMLRERIPGSTTNQSQGVSVEVGETQAAVDLSIVADYGVAIPGLAEGIRRNVINAVERMTGLEVTEVNIDVTDVYLPQEDEESEPEPRVQ